MGSLTHIRRGIGARQAGAELVEFAIALPLLLLVMLGMFDFGFAFQRYLVITNAAREGARVGVLPGYDVADVQARVAAYVTAAELPGTATTTVSAVTIPTPGGGTTPGIQVAVQYPHAFTFLGPVAGWFGGSFGTVTLTATATMRREVAGATGS